MLPELLAPAGGMEALRAAVQHGADAVYLGLTEYSARKSAENFTIDALEEAVNYCHIRGVSVYLTLNTLVPGEELSRCVKLGEVACKKGIDAIIVQDLGLATELKNLGLPIHSSTQLTVYNEAGAEKMKNSGFSRVVLARELTLDEIGKISRNSGVETEVFCHGALCMCYSGQCLMSYFQGGRSGNKGDCAQPCRMKYKLNSGKSDYLYHLSPGDLCSLPFLDKLVATGTSSLKIEGRLKNPEYVGIVTSVYRKALDKIASGEKDFFKKEDIDKLTLAFSRSSFTSGHMLGKMPSSHITLETPGRTGLLCGKVTSAPTVRKGPVPLFEIKAKLSTTVENGDGIGFNGKNGGVVNGYNPKTGTILVAGTLPKVKAGDDIFITYKKSLAENINATTKKEGRKSEITMHFSALKDKDMSLTLCDGKHQISVFSAPALSAESKATTLEDIKAPLTALGNTPYGVTDFTASLDDGLFIPKSILKDLRRQAVDKLSLARCEVTEFEPLQKVAADENGNTTTITGRSYFFFRTIDFLKWTLPSDAVRVYIPFETFSDNKALEKSRDLRNSGVEVYCILPWINKNYSAEGFNNIRPYIDGFMAENIGDSQLINDAPIASDISLNCINSVSARELKTHGYSTITISPETDPSDLPEIPEGVTPEIVTEGRIIVMRSEHCPIATSYGKVDGKNCGQCTKVIGRTFTLTDTKGASYPLVCDPFKCRMIMLSKEDIKDTHKKFIEKAREAYGNRLLERINIFGEE
ncbi:MAG: U32 family peptidase [Ruminococcaceae bacterium]|nr:U32 family peptidase [Oscillospiraceae bacterium]